MHRASIAYFSMEIGLEVGMPTYSGGLGILAGDTIRSAADLEVPMVAVTLLHRRGYFFQKLDDDGRQYESPIQWPIEEFLDEMEPQVKVGIEDRIVLLRAWRYEVKGQSGHIIPVYFIDADLPENSDDDREITHFLYGGDQEYRMDQEIVLGIGGVRILRALGYGDINRFHMNEGHSSLLTLELLQEEAEKDGRDKGARKDVEEVRKKCVFTTHTPVSAGHDQFPMELVEKKLGHWQVFFDFADEFTVEMWNRVTGVKREEWETLNGELGDQTVLNMTYLALNLSHYINGVAKRHQEVTKLMFADYPISSITNGVHGVSWTSEPIQNLFDEYIHGWRQDNFSLRYALNIPNQKMWEAHQDAKKKLVDYVNRQYNAGLSLQTFTIGFARRATPYKRGRLFFSDLDRLRSLADKVGPIQVIYGGKAHPKDGGGREIIQDIFEAKNALAGTVEVIYVENYDMEMGKMLTSGVDLWLNTPLPPNEASGTSGMKAALNGVPSLSVLDGWWIEGWIEGVTGWAIDGVNQEERAQYDPRRDADSLYDKLETEILPLYYQNRPKMIDVMKHCIALNGAFFNTQRMVQQYVLKAYFLD